MYVLLYGFTGCLLAATYAYFNATITTIEKRYRIPSRNTGIISTGNDISSVFVSAILSYYGGKSHRPHWMAMGLVGLAIFCFMNVVPHWLYGAGEDALLLTVEHEAEYRGNNSTAFLENEKRKLLCLDKGDTDAQCDMGTGSWSPQIILFVAQLISGVGQTLYYTLGTTYMDDNIQKSKSATYLSISYFMRLLGPAFGYTMGSYCLRIFIDPSLTPTITIKDPRWLGAWWLGWIVLGIPLMLAVPFLAMFPKSLPRAAVRRVIHRERLRRELSVPETKVVKASVRDMFVTFKRLLRNKTYMLKTVSDMFYVFGYMPYWTFTPKYLETQYHQSASTAR